MTLASSPYFEDRNVGMGRSCFVLVLIQKRGKQLFYFSNTCCYLFVSKRSVGVFRKMKKGWCCFSSAKVFLAAGVHSKGSFVYSAVACVFLGAICVLFVPQVAGCTSVRSS
jgi:hypothetical protein